MINRNFLNLGFLLISGLLFTACETNTPEPEDKKEPNETSCTATITLDATSTDAGCGQSVANIVVVAEGGEAPYQYKLDDGSFQSEATFNDLSAGSYKLTVQDNNGCEETMNHNVLTGVSFEGSVQTIIAQNCATSNCHDGSTGLPDLSTLSGVQTVASIVKSRVASGTMPPSNSGLELTDTQIETIVCWINDGALDN